MKFVPYESRIKAGEILADFVSESDATLYNRINKRLDGFISFAIPNGGVPVVEGFCRKLKINYDLIIVRKIKIPHNTEAGFGSITPDGTVLINNDLLYQLNLSEKQVKYAIEITEKEIKARLLFYKKNYNLEEKYINLIKNKIVFMVDDGLASGFTMLAAIKMIKKYNPKEIYIAIPTAPLNTLNRINKEVNKCFCPNIRDTRWFAVADAYEHWYDVPDSEVLEIIKSSHIYMETY